MITKSRILFLAGIIFTACLMTISSCKKEEEDSLNIPELPPAEALLMDFSDFENSDDTLGGKKSFENLANGYTYRNWGSSFLTVSFWNTVATITLAVPTSCYLKTLESDPVYKGDNTWEWTATYSTLLTTYEARLVAKRISNEEYIAEMYISTEGTPSYTDFKWFEGIIHFNRTHAIWTLFESPVNPVQVIDVEWNKDWETNISDIRYTFVKNGSDLEGSYIEYKIWNTEVYDAKYTVDFKGDFCQIEWNRTNKNGHIKDFEIFGDNNWHCWNGMLQDVSCE